TSIARCENACRRLRAVRVNRPYLEMQNRTANIESQKYRREFGQFLPVTAVVHPILRANADHQHSESRAATRLNAPLVSRLPDAQDSAAHCGSVAGVHHTIPRPASDCQQTLPASPVWPDRGFA